MVDRRKNRKRNPETSKRANERKRMLLGMPHGTASARLLKAILYGLVVELKKNFCFRCGGEICTADDLSIEHMRPWQVSVTPVTDFFDLDNISFSHRPCNYSAGAKPHKKYASDQERWAANELKRGDRSEYREGYNALRRERRSKRAKNNLVP